ncbi:MAG: OmpA family protein, partial [Rickettsiales bacterium]
PCRQEFLHEMEGLEEVVATLGPAPTISLPTSITILFPSDSSELTHDGEYAIREIVAITTLSPHYRITVTGHTDRSGRAEYNQALSEARAERVKHALVDAGLDIERITTAAAGEEALATPTLDGILRRQNRRVVVSITSDAMTNEKEEKEE